LEATLAHQEESGSAIVVELLKALGVPRDRLVIAEDTRSTREEVRAGADLVRQHGVDRLAAITSIYHVPRVRRYLADHLPVGRFAVYSPECFYRDATAQERAWINAGTPTAETLAQEGVVERRWLACASVAGCLPGDLRFELEARVAQLYAAIGDRR
jgi:uncharacterized SAM-binding protein YcdF (DUF218 family)